MFDRNFSLLKMEAAKMGYQVYLVSDRYVSSCGHLTKTINISKQNGEVNAIFEFAHELGHCIQFKKIWEKLNGDKELVKTYYRNRDKSKIKFLISEIDAWIKGYPILKRNNISVKGYWLHAFYCVASHLIKTKPNSVKD
jgi:hypothetical protein